MRLSDIEEALRLGAKDGGMSDLFAEAKDERRWEKVRCDPCYADVRRELHKEKKRTLKEPIRVLPYSLMTQFVETGKRKPFEREYFSRRKRLNTLALWARLEKNNTDVTHLEDTMWAICDEVTWALPAHLPPSSLRDGSARYHIDLFAAETGFALSEILFLLQEDISAAVVERTQREIRERIIDAYLRQTFHWEQAEHNWAAVCAGSVGATVLYTLKAAERLTTVLHRVLGSMACYLNGFDKDGACREGLVYWTYGFGFYTYFSELLRQRTAGRIDLLQGEKVQAIARFQQKMMLTGDHIVSFSDSARRSTYQVGLTHRLKQRFPGVEVPDVIARAGLTDDPCGRWAHAVRNVIWRTPNVQEGLQDAIDVLPEAQWLVARQRTRQGTACFAAKGGHNGEPHNHNDVGTFLFHVEGDTLLTDTGYGEYTKAYFGPERYTLIVNSSAGHSVPIIEGTWQKPGRKYAAVLTDTEVTDHRAEMSLDLTRAYADSNLASCIRTFHFDASRPRLNILDAYRFYRPPSSVVERFVTLWQPQVSEDATVLIRGKRVCGVMSADSELAAVHIGETTFMNHNAKEETLYTIDWHIQRPRMEMNVGFTLDLRDESYVGSESFFV